MKLVKRLMLVIAVSFAIGCCHQGVGFTDKPLKPVWENVAFVKIDPKCKEECDFLVTHTSLVNYNINNDNDDLLHEAYEQRIDECNNTIAGD